MKYINLQRRKYLMGITCNGTKCYHSKEGISLISLIITIIVILILSSIVIFNLVQNNLYDNANKAVFLNDVRSFQMELDVYKGKQYQDNSGVYSFNKLQADDSSVIYDGVVDAGKTIKDIIPSLANNIKYANQFSIVNGELIFKGADENRQDWSNEIGLKIIITAPTNMVSYRGNIDTVYTFSVTGNASASGTVWGTDIYTDDSNISKAVVHAGILANGETGVVNIRVLAGLSSYAGTTRNGVTTVNYGNWPGSYEFISE
jgi:type II secretory pathway pseudopilin PulG